MDNLREKILAAQDLKEEMVFIPEWETTVLVRGMSGRQRARLLQDAIDSQGNVDLEKIYPDLVVYSTYNPETRELIFQPTDRDAISEKSGTAIERIAQVAAQLSGLNQRSLAQAGKN